MDTATLIWNGNGIEGKDNIQKFWTDLPPSDHSVFTLDAQPITGKYLYIYISILSFCSMYAFIKEKYLLFFYENS